jgi:hypothetical protein
VANAASNGASPVVVRGRVTRSSGSPNALPPSLVSAARPFIRVSCAMAIHADAPLSTTKRATVSEPTSPVDSSTCS